LLCSFGAVSHRARARAGRHGDRVSGRGSEALAAVLYEMLAGNPLERTVNQPDAWLQMDNRSERYEALRRDPRGKAALESIEAW
jgi:hypothetical protein